MTKVVVVHKDASQVERDWAKQYAGLDSEARKPFETVVNWAERSSKVCMIDNLDWTSIVAAVTDAASTAGAGGTVIIVSGHGGRVKNDAEAGIVVWDPKASHVDMGWRDGKMGKGLFWDYETSVYADIIPQGNPPSRKAEDERDIANDKSPGQKNTVIAQKRLAAFNALDQIAKALQAAKVKRLTLTCCTVGDAPQFIDRLAKILKVEVAAFKSQTKVFDDTEYNKKVGGKSRLVMESDYQLGDGKATNVPWARVETPNLDGGSLAYVGKP